MMDTAKLSETLAWQGRNPTRPDQSRYSTSYLLFAFIFLHDRKVSICDWQFKNNQIEMLKILTSIFRYVEQLLGARAGSPAVGVGSLQGLADGLPERGARAGADQRKQQPRGHPKMPGNSLRRQAGLAYATGNSLAAVRLNFFKIAKPNFQAARKPRQRRWKRHQR